MQGLPFVTQWSPFTASLWRLLEEVDEYRVGLGMSSMRQSVKNILSSDIFSVGISKSTTWIP